MRRDRELATLLVALANLLLTLFLYVLLTAYHLTYVKPMQQEQQFHALDLEDLRIDKAARDKTAGQVIVVQPKEADP